MIGSSEASGGSRRVARVSRMGPTACALVVALWGCSGATGGGGGGGGGGSSNLITNEEVLSRTESDAYDLVEQLRISWLRPRTAGTLSSGGPIYPEVFLDNTHYGPVESLRTIATPAIDYIEFISATNATTLYGTGYLGGVIHVHSRSRGG